MFTNHEIRSHRLSTPRKAVVCADDGLPVKPAGDAVVHIGALTGIGPARTAVIGDSVADLAMGRAAGAARCYGVLTGVATREDLAPFADAILTSVAELRPDATGAPPDSPG